MKKRQSYYWVSKGSDWLLEVGSEEFCRRAGEGVRKSSNLPIHISWWDIPNWEVFCNVINVYVYVVGVGKSKKLAKRNAAYAMLQLLKQGMTVPQGEGEQQEEYDDESIPLVSKIQTRHCSPLTNPIVAFLKWITI